MKPKNTKGPWVIAKDNQTIKSDETYICRIRYPFSPIDENDEIAANARLIAAAPEMLEALENALAWIDRSHKYGSDMESSRLSCLLDASGILSDAIKKARGES